MNTIQIPPYYTPYEYTIQRGPDQGKILRFRVHGNKEITGPGEKHVKIVEADKRLNSVRYRAVQIFARHKECMVSVKMDNGERVAGNEVCCAVFFPHHRDQRLAVPFFGFPLRLFNSIFTDPNHASADSTDSEEEAAFQEACAQSLTELHRDAKRRRVE